MDTVPEGAKGPPWKQRDFTISRSEFAWLWKLGGGKIDPDMKQRHVEPVDSTTKNLASAAGPPVSEMESFGDFLETATRTADIFNTRDLEDPILAFAKWAGDDKGGRYPWDVMHSLFHPQEGTGCARGMYSGRRKCRAAEFVNFVRSLGFEGNAIRIFAEIKRHGCPKPVHSKAAKRAAGIDDEDDALFDETDEISISQLQHFQKRLTKMLSDLKAADEGSPAARLIKMLREKRGCIFRAWRLDLDVHENGKIDWNDLVVACKNLGISKDLRHIWNSFRPDGSSKPLELWEFDSEEAATVNHFMECIWATTGFDLDKAWDLIDAGGRKMVTMEEWLQGVKCIGFEGNAKVLYQGLGVFGLNHLWRTDFDYLEVLSNASLRSTFAAAPIRSLRSWVQSQYGNPQVFLDKVGVPHQKKAKFRLAGGKFSGEDEPDEVKQLGVSDLSARLTALGYPGDAFQVAIIAAKAGGTSYVKRGQLLGLLVGKHHGAPPQRGCELRMTAHPRRGSRSKEKKNVTPWRPKRAWRDYLDTVSKSNDRLPACVRTYFSVPEQTAGFSLTEGSTDGSPKLKARSVSPRVRSASPKVDSGRGDARTRSLTPRRNRPDSPRQRLDFDESGFNLSNDEKGSRFVWGSDNPSVKAQLKRRPPFDNKLHYSSEVNAKKSSYARTYFNDYHERPVKQDIVKRMTEKRMTRIAAASQGLA